MVPYLVCVVSCFISDLRQSCAIFRGKGDRGDGARHHRDIGDLFEKSPAPPIMDRVRLIVGLGLELT